MDLTPVLKYVKGYYGTQECSATSMGNELNYRNIIDFRNPF